MFRVGKTAAVRKTSGKNEFAFVRLENRECLSVDLTNVVNLNKSNLWQSIREPVASGPYVYFVGKDPGSSDLDLWQVNSTNDGVRRMVSLGPDDNQPRHLFDVNGTLYFQGFSAETGRELWKTNGTVAGTTIVRDLAPGARDSKLSKPVRLGDNLFLVGGSGDVFRVDTATQRMVRLIDLMPRSDSAENLTVSGGMLYFTAKVNSSAQSIYRSNGRASGTAAVQNLPAGSFTELTDVAGDLYFVADQGTELWKIEHPSLALADVKRLDALYELTDVGGTLFFANFSELWKSDGTDAGTVFLKETYGDLSNLFNQQGRLFFAGGSTQQFSGNGIELWTSDGTVGGTVEFDLNPDFNEGYGYGSYPSNFVDLDGKLYFTTNSGVWISDGTLPGTRAIESGSSVNLTKKNGLLFYDRVAPDSPFVGFWRRAPNAIKDVEILRAGTGKSDSSPSAPVSLNGTIYFAADNGKSGRELWQLDGDGKPSLVIDVNPGRASSHISNLSSVNGKLFFTAYSPLTGSGLWTSDGTAIGTTFLQRVSVMGLPEKPGSFKALGNEVFFTGFAPGSGVELWKSDGTAAGTVLVKDIFPGMTYNPDDRTLSPNSSSPSDFVEFNGELYFAATEDVHGRELWKTDGTVSGTILVADLYPGVNQYYYDQPFSSYVRGLVVHNNKLYFSAARATGWKMWRSDGTSEGSIPFTNSVATPFYAGPTFVGNAMYFIGNRDELWTSNGTKASTRLVKDLNSSLSAPFPSQLTAVGDQLYFVANDPANGTELWRSDGTAEGTNPVADLNPGAADSNPQELTIADGMLFLTAETTASGRELYRVASNTSGLGLVRHASASVKVSAPKNLSVIDGEVYFSAVTKAFGRELWKTNSAPSQMLTASSSLTQRPDSNSFPLLEPGGVRTLRWPSQLFHNAETRGTDGAVLNLSIANGFSPGDRLLIQNFGGITTTGGEIVQFNGVAIARLVCTDRHLGFHFFSLADLHSVQVLMRAVQFHASSMPTSVGLRTIRLSFLDGKGGESIDHFVRFQVVFDSTND